MNIHIGIDDTDSPKGGCTTYIAALLVDRLTKLGAEFLDYPNLVRLNPNVPWKTRGNGSICLRIRLSPTIESSLKKLVIKTVEENSDIDYDNTNPGIVFQREVIPKSYRIFSKATVEGLVSLKTAEKLIEDNTGHAIGYNNRRGIIGALAAIGGLVNGDYTYELLAYRLDENIGKPRKIDVKSVLDMDNFLKGDTFNNIDPEKGSILISPQGPDPVLYGVRGESAEAVHEAYLRVKTNEPIERWVIFRSNQGTDAHLTKKNYIKKLQPDTPAILLAKICSKPSVIKGGHAFIKIENNTGMIDCAAYEPTGKFRDIVKQLIPGDVVQVYGGVKKKENGLTLNLEKLAIIELAKNIESINPSCTECGGSMESMGRESGYRCKKCGYRNGKLKKIKVVRPRKLSTGLYSPPERAHRHLTKPLKRYGKEKRDQNLYLHEPWHQRFYKVSKRKKSI
jgi:tRNA(Ile2)-agmatinylcytidine synthase